jgi:hypothetical protein
VLAYDRVRPKGVAVRRAPEPVPLRAIGRALQLVCAPLRRPFAGRRGEVLLTVYFGTPSMFITLWFGFDYGTNPPLGTLII